MSSAVHRYAAPAKLNLFLHVIGRRSDGYHLLQSAMQLIDLADTVTITPTDDGVVRRDGDVDGVPEDDDLAIRAAKALQAATGTTRGATIAVEKRIPMGGGLGGGSSDAATVLLALNRLWKLDLSRERLMGIGLTLGADVPFFVFGRSAFAEGIGEALRAIDLPTAHYAVVHPGVAVPTVAIFQSAELTRDTEALKISDFSEVGSGSFDTAAGKWKNDLEAVAVARYPAVADALRWLDDQPGALGRARMSGSGACVFRAFESAGRAARCVDAVPDGWRGWSVRSLAIHPHLDGA